MARHMIYYLKMDLVLVLNQKRDGVSHLITPVLGLTSVNALCIASVMAKANINNAYMCELQAIFICLLYLALRCAFAPLPWRTMITTKRAVLYVTLCEEQLAYKTVICWKR